LKTAPCWSNCGAHVATPSKGFRSPTHAGSDTLASLAKAELCVAVGDTPLGRGLVAPSSIGKKTVVAVPTVNSLVVTDSPMDEISIYGDTQHQRWQETHGHLPPELLDFIEGEPHASIFLHL
jgi:hypothetical protein